MIQGKNAVRPNSIWTNTKVVGIPAMTMNYWDYWRFVNEPLLSKSNNFQSTKLWRKGDGQCHALFNRILAKDFSQSYFYNTIHRKNKNEACQVEDIVKVASQESGLHVPVRFRALHALVGDVGGETLVQPMTKSRFTRWDGKMDKSRSTVTANISWRHKKSSNKKLL